MYRRPVRGPTGFQLGGRGFHLALGGEHRSGLWVIPWSREKHKKINPWWADDRSAGPSFPEGIGGA
jgi:hypothetical protein